MVQLQQSSGQNQQFHKVFTYRPILFCIFINDILNIELQHTNADDFKVHRKIRNAFDIEILQSKVNNLEDWCRRNKCGVIIFFRNRHKIYPRKYSIINTPLKKIEMVKDQGIIMKNKLIFRSHINNVITKASQMDGCIERMDTVFVVFFYRKLSIQVCRRTIK